MNKYLSVKLRIISLISIILVVLLHSNNTTVKFNSGNMNFDNGYNVFMQNFFSLGITRIAVPIFFCISGYLYFLNTKGTIQEFLQKYKKRGKTLLIPYLIWSTWGVLFYFTLQLLPQSKDFFTKDLITSYSFSKTLNTIIRNPIPYQLWFVRDLIILVVVSPLIYWATKYFKIIPVMLLFIVWLELFEFSFVILSSDAIFFFCLGAYLAIFKSEFMVKKLNKRVYIVFIFVWVLIVLVKTSLMYQHSEKTIEIISLLLHKMSIGVGIIALWSVYDILMINKEKPNVVILNLSSLTFFIYAFHEPVLTIVKKGLFYMGGVSEMLSITVYFVAPIITIFLSILVGSFMRRYMLGFYKLITGGR